MDEAQREARMARFGEYLKRLRKKERKMTQLDLAQKAGLSQGYIGFLEQQRELPSRGAIKRLAEALEADYDTMMAAAGYGESNPTENDEDDQRAMEGVATEDTGAPGDAGSQNSGGRRAALAGQLDERWGQLDERWGQQGEDSRKKDSLDPDDLERIAEMAWNFILQAPDWPAAQSVRDEEISLRAKVGFIDLYQRASGRTLLKPLEVTALTAHIQPVSRPAANRNAENLVVMGAEEHRSLGTASGRPDPEEVL